MSNIGPRTSSKRWKIAALILAIPVFVLAAELFLRLIPVETHYENRFFLLNRSLDYPEIFLRDSKLFWKFRPDQTITSKFFEGRTYRINSSGFRGEEIPPASDKVRIIALGNSCTFGWGMNDDAVFINQLGAMINGDGQLPPVEIINAGIPGYSSFQGRRFLVSDIAPLKPDIALIMFAWNDQWAAADNIPDKDIQFASQAVLDIQNFFARFKLYGVLRRLILSATEESLDDKLNKENPVYRVGLDDFYANLNTMVQYCIHEGIIPILMTSPIPALEKYYPPGSRSPMHVYHHYYNLQTRDVARNSKSILIDLAAEFDKYDDLYDDAPKDPIHFNAKGHKLAAELIFKYLKENSYLLAK